MLGVECKTYFDHYYGRLRDYSRCQRGTGCQTYFARNGRVGEMTRDACWQFYLEHMGPRADSDAFGLRMTDLENDFYLRYEVDTRRYQFACKLLRDWWLRHYGMVAGS